MKPNGWSRMKARWTTLGVQANQHSHIRNAKTSQEAWKILKNVYESKSAMRQGMLIKELTRIEMKSDRDMAE